MSHMGHVGGKMEEKNLPVKNENVKNEGPFSVGAALAVGEAKAFNAIEKLSRLAKIKLLVQLNETGEYKTIPGCSSMREVFKAVGMSKTTAYKEMESFRALGEDRVELLVRLGITPHEINLLSKYYEVGNVEFEVLDAGQGKYRISGREMTLQNNQPAIREAIVRLVEELHRERLATQGAEKTAATRGEKIKKLEAEIERKNKKIEIGEEALRQKRRRLEGFQQESDSDIGRLITELLLIIAKIEKAEVKEDDMPYIGQYLDLLESAMDRIVIKLRDYLPKDETDI